MRINYQRNQIGMLAAVFSLVGVTLYMAFAFPYSLLHFKQSESSEMKAVIIVGRHGEVTPARESYFDAFGEQPPEQWFQLGGPGQLTNRGKERLFLLGKFLKLRYHERLLAGSPRKLHVRAEDSDRSLESAQALVAGLNPPRDQWVWSLGGDGLHEFAASWQPKAVHTARQTHDDLLASQSKCLELDTLRATWKNSSQYSQSLNEFRHDLQMLRQNTGLEFEDDLEMAANLVEQLAARVAFEPAAAPAWYTSTLAQRLAYIADVTASCRFSQASAQRLFAGRLLDTIVKNIFAKIRSDLTAGISPPLTEPDSSDEPPSSESLVNFNTSTKRARNPRRADQAEGLAGRKLMPRDEQVKLRLERQNEPNMFIYITDKQHLSALMNSLKIYASQPQYGAALIIELHYDPLNQIHFLRLFLVNSASHNVLPEPVRVNPIACLDSVECSPQAFEQNTRRLALDKEQWASLCSNIDKFEQQEELAQQPTSTTPLPTISNSSLDSLISTDDSQPNSTGAGETTITADRSDSNTAPSSPAAPSINETTTTASNVSDTNDSIHLDKLDESLVVGPTTVSSEPPTGSSGSDDQLQLESEAPSQSSLSTTETTESTLAPEDDTVQSSTATTLPVLSTEVSAQTNTLAKIEDVGQPIELETTDAKSEP